MFAVLELICLSVVANAACHDKISCETLQNGNIFLIYTYTTIFTPANSWRSNIGHRQDKRQDRYVGMEDLHVAMPILRSTGGGITVCNVCCRSVPVHYTLRSRFNRRKFCLTKNRTRTDTHKL
ncbi:hypothetical protein LZ32DRAFT_371732 [Colletotrichum eremochloae]|nr:hypothetical protein LZ32DRAFT_371732 [Colletotrichum eremochloae]